MALQVVVVDSDLMFTTKIAGLLSAAGHTVRTLRRPSVLDAVLAGQPTPDVVLVNLAGRDLDWRSVVASSLTASVPVVAYGPHVDVALQGEARAAGATRVLPNARLDVGLPALVARAVRAFRAGASEPTDTDATLAGTQHKTRTKDH